MKVSDTSTYLEAAALTGPIRLTIECARSVRDDEKGLDGRPMSKKSMIISYRGAKKEHVACRTVQKQIRAMHGDDATKWAGKQITIYPTTCNAFGNPKTPCIRVKIELEEEGE